MKTFIEVVGGLCVICAAACLSGVIFGMGILIVTGDETVIKYACGGFWMSLGVILPMFAVYKLNGWEVGK